jgi:PHS family inorganic phosphate transporter-like MFS transporter
LSRQFLKQHGIQLLGCTSTWFLLDIAFYSQNLFQKDIFTAIGWLPPATTMSALEEVYRVSRAQALIALVSTVPGYWVTVALVDVIGRWVIQMIGFFFMTFLALYALTFFFSNFGPNVTTFIIPAELFPARLRSTCHGISAASGKAGAIVGAFGFLYAAQNQVEGKQDPGYPTGIGLKNSFLLLSIINAAGFFCTFLVPETKGRSLEDLSGENDAEQQRAPYNSAYMDKNPAPEYRD